MTGPFRSLPLLALLLASTTPLAQPPGSARLEGTVFAAPGRPAAAARVLLVPQTGGAVREAKTGPKGSYRFEGLRHGYYRCVIVAGGRAYPGNRILLVPPGKKVEADWVLGPLTARDRLAGLSERESVPEAGGLPAGGVAHLREKLGPTGLRWLTTGRGALVLLGGATALVAVLIASSGSEPAASASAP